MLHRGSSVLVRIQCKLFNYDNLLYMDRYNAKPTRKFYDLRTELKLLKKKDQMVLADTQTKPTQPHRQFSYFAGL